MKFFLFIPFLCSLTLHAQLKSNAAYLGGTWVPVEWNQGVIDTYWIHDTTVIVITSIQGKLGDSIVFNSSQGLAIRSGTFKQISRTKYLISTKIKLCRGNVDCADIARRLNEPVKNLSSNIEQVLSINNHLFKRGLLYTQNSTDSLYKIVVAEMP